MIKEMITSFSKSASIAEYNGYKKIVEQINAIKLDKLDKPQLLDKSMELRARVLNGASLDEVIIEAFALVKEAALRVLELRAFDEQLIAGIAMHEGRLIEMQTGEGKTLAAVFPAYLNALSGTGCHILTFNDYLAGRDAVWMGPIYELLGLTVGFVQDIMKGQERQKAYGCDITYVTAKVAGFDYLRDSLCYEKGELTQREFNFAIIDEADSIIIDEARIPLVIAAGGYAQANTISSTIEIISNLEYKIHYDKDEGKKNVFLTEAGLSSVETSLNCGNLYAEENFNLLSEVHNALYGEVLLKKDVDYIVKDGKIEMVDEFTGRVAENRHWPDGIQAALEAKEGIGIQSKGLIMSQITLQSFVLLYKKIAGMTATAKDSAEEILEFYDLKVFEIPPHIPCKRLDYPDVIFTHKAAKFKVLIKEIQEVHGTGQPILIGTSSVKESEYLAQELNRVDIPCKILNAKNDELEAGIIAEAGTLGAITVSTNMAGRGSDIKLGGNKEVNREKIVALGGLYVIGINRHESLRIDKQLRGRTGRQGDPGMSKFFISLEDDLIKKYGIDALIPEVIRPKNQELPLPDPSIAKKIGQVQRIIQGKDSDLRRALWNYSSFVENHRVDVYKRRKEILMETIPYDILLRENQQLYEKLITLFGTKVIKELEKKVTLFNIDESFAEYIAEVAIIREGIHLKVLGGKNPLREFQKETTELFEELQQLIGEGIVKDFENMELSKVGINSLKERVKPPSSTWTYLVNDKTLIEGLSLMMMGNGALATIFSGPIVLIFVMIKKFFVDISGGFKEK